MSTATIAEKLRDLHDELHRDGYGIDVDSNTAHVRDVLDELISILRQSIQSNPAGPKEIAEHMAMRNRGEL